MSRCIRLLVVCVAATWGCKQPARIEATDVVGLWEGSKTSLTLLKLSRYKGVIGANQPRISLTVDRRFEAEAFPLFDIRSGGYGLAKGSGQWSVIDMDGRRAIALHFEEGGRTTVNVNVERGHGGLLMELYLGDPDNGNRIEFRHVLGSG